LDQEESSERTIQIIQRRYEEEVDLRLACRKVGIGPAVVRALRINPVELLRPE
jgi:hypothetical protein